MLDQFTTAYVEALLWASTDDDGAPLDDTYGPSDIHPDSLAKIKSDCAKFQAEQSDKIASDLVRAGHDFFLTRNGHGAGFWDGDWPEHGDALTEASHAYGEMNPYVGDDGMIHV